MRRMINVTQPFLDAQFDIFDWHPYFQSCVRYFVEHAQYNGPVQALAAFINIQLPFQKAQNTSNHILSRSSPGPAAAAASPNSPLPPFPPPAPAYHVTLQPYIRRLIATGFDVPAVLHGFFGDDCKQQSEFFRLLYGCVLGAIVLPNSSRNTTQKEYIS
jgi:hypothetical protein